MGNSIFKPSPCNFKRITLLFFHQISFVRLLSGIGNTIHACRVTLVGSRNCVYLSVYIWYMACGSICTTEEAMVMMTDTSYY